MSPHLTVSQIRSRHQPLVSLHVKTKALVDGFCLSAEAGFQGQLRRALQGERELERGRFPGDGDNKREVLPAAS